MRSCGSTGRGQGVLEELYVDFVYQPLRDAAGAVFGIMAHAVETTTQVSARRDVEALAAERAAVLGQVADVVVTTDPNGRITFANAAARVDLRRAPRRHGDLGRTRSRSRCYDVDGTPHARAQRAARAGAARRARARRGVARAAAPTAREVLVHGERRAGHARPTARAIGAAMTRARRDRAAAAAARGGARAQPARRGVPAGARAHRGDAGPRARVRDREPGVPAGRRCASAARRAARARGASRSSRARGSSSCSTACTRPASRSSATRSSPASTATATA